MKNNSYMYINHLSVPLKVFYGVEDAQGNSFPFYYCDREELIEYLINNDYEVQEFLNIIGAVQCLYDEKTDIIGLYVDDVERAFKEYFRLRKKSLFADILNTKRGK